MNRFVNYCPGEYIDLKQNCNCNPPPPKPCNPKKDCPEKHNCFDDFNHFFTTFLCFPQKNRVCPRDKCDDFDDNQHFCKQRKCDCKNNSLMLFIGGLLIGQMFNNFDDC